MTVFFAEDVYSLVHIAIPDILFMAYSSTGWSQGSKHIDRTILGNHIYTSIRAYIFPCMFGEETRPDRAEDRAEARWSFWSFSAPMHTGRWRRGHGRLRSVDSGTSRWQVECNFPSIAIHSGLQQDERIARCETTFGGFRLDLKAWL